MSTIDSENISKPETQPKVRRKVVKKAMAAKKSPQAKKAAGKPKSDGANKKAEVIAMMKRAKGATLAAANRRIVRQLSGRRPDRVPHFRGTRLHTSGSLLA
jgi:hypothetical protein